MCLTPYSFKGHYHFSLKLVFLSLFTKIVLRFSCSRFSNNLNSIIPKLLLPCILPLSQNLIPCCSGMFTFVVANFVSEKYNPPQMHLSKFYCSIKIEADELREKLVELFWGKWIKFWKTHYYYCCSCCSIFSCASSEFHVQLNLIYQESLKCLVRYFGFYILYLFAL